MTLESNRKKLQVTAKNQQQDWDSTFQLMSWWDTEVIKTAKVMVVGAGALGNEVLKNLTLLNVGNILVMDFDDVEYANLNRSILFRESDCGTGICKSEIAAERIRKINPNVKVMSIEGDVTTDIGLGVFRRMDVIIGCLDNRLARLFLNRACYKVNKTWVDGGIENLAGQLNVYKPNVSCYECGLTPADWKNIKFRLGCPDVARRNYAQGKIPTTPISSSIIGAMQVQEALKVVYKNDKQSMAGETFFYEGMNNIAMTYNTTALKEECMSHYEYENIISSPLSANSSIKEVLDWLSSHFEEDFPVIQLENSLVLKLTTKISENTQEVLVPKFRFTEEMLQSYRKEPDEDVIFLEELSTLTKDFLHQDISLADVGIPKLHILEVLTEEGVHHVELTGDEKYLVFN